MAKKYPYYGLKAYLEVTEGDEKFIFTEKDIRYLIITRPSDGSSITFGGNWTDKHTQIVKESEEKFKTHTKDQEVDI